MHNEAEANCDCMIRSFQPPLFLPDSRLSLPTILNSLRPLPMAQKRVRKTSIKKGPKKAAGKGRKRQKIAHDAGPLNIVEAQKQRKRGILERAADVPVDILCEIMSHLSPKDLLSLTKTSRDLEAFLTDNAYSWIWLQARKFQEPELPPLPRGYREYEYANLVFDTHCHECEQPSAKTVLWTAKVRLCGKCFEDESVTSFEMPSWVDPILEEVSRHVNPKYAPKPISINVRARSRRDESLTNSAPHVWYLNDVDELMAQLEGLKQSGDDAKIQEWLNEKKSEAKDGVKLCEALDAFTVFMQNRRYAELKALRHERGRSVMKRLKAAGWEAEIAYRCTSEEILQNELVDQPKPLTDKAWKDIEHTLTPLLEKIRVELKAESRAKVLNARIQLFSKKYEYLVADLPVFPPINDIIRYTPFKELIFDTVTTSKQQIDPSQIDEALHLHLSSTCTKWRSSHEDTLTSMLTSSTQPDLSLASNAFQCLTCSSLLTYPALLLHPCYRSHINNRDAANLTQSSSVKFFYHVPYEWTKRQLERVIMACGLDPASATAGEMDGLDVFVYCVPCSKAGKWREPDERASRRSNPSTFAFRWNDAVAMRHIVHDEGSPSWAVLPDGDLLQAVRKEDSRRNFGGLDDYLRRVKCLRCDEQHIYDVDKMDEHLLSAHEIKVTRYERVVPTYYRLHITPERYVKPVCYVVQPRDGGGFNVTVTDRLRAHVA